VNKEENYSKLKIKKKENEKREKIKPNFFNNINSIKKI
jgi:hypothetical protein